MNIYIELKEKQLKNKETLTFIVTEKLGYALVMDLATISIGSFRDGILKVAAVHNNSYRIAAKKRSSLLRDLPINPRKLATWWVEHVAKYKGAEHLKSSARYVHWNFRRNFFTP